MEVNSSGYSLTAKQQAKYPSLSLTPMWKIVLVYTTQNPKKLVYCVNLPKIVGS